MTDIIQPSFTSGEIAPSHHARIDLARYYTALKTCRNWMVLPYGGVINRSGTRLVTIAPGEKVRVIPFQFSTIQTYALVFGHEYIRIIKDGAIVLYSSGQNAGQPVEIATPYQGEDLFRLKFTQSADVLTITHKKYQPRELTRSAHDALTLSLFTNREGLFWMKAGTTTPKQLMN